VQTGTVLARHNFQKAKEITFQRKETGTVSLYKCLLKFLFLELYQSVPITMHCAMVIELHVRIAKICDLTLLQCTYHVICLLKFVIRSIIKV